MLDSGTAGGKRGFVAVVVVMVAERESRSLTRAAQSCTTYERERIRDLDIGNDGIAVV